MKSSLDLPQLRDEIASSFNEAELQSLCFDLDINYEDLPGTTRQIKIIELIKYCDRDDKIGMLLQRCQTLKPNRHWHFLEETPLALQVNAPTLDYQTHILSVEKNLTLIIENCKKENRPFRLDEIFPILRKLFNRHTYSEPFALCKDENWHDRFIAAVQTGYFLGEYWFEIQSAATREKDLEKLESFEKTQHLLRKYTQEMTELFKPKPFASDVKDALKSGSTDDLRNRLIKNRCLQNKVAEKQLTRFDQALAKCESIRIEIESEVNQWPKI